MNNFSFYRKGITNKKPALELSVQRAIDRIRSEEYRSDIERLRAATDKSVRNVIKGGLDYFTFSGTFKSRSADQLIKHSGIICLDIDDLDPEKYIHLREHIPTDRHTLACFQSPSGNGLKVLVKINPQRHLESFLELEEYYDQMWSVQIDKSGKDIPRACFVSYDPEAFLNLDSEPFIATDRLDGVAPAASGTAAAAGNMKPAAKVIEADFTPNASLQQARFVTEQIVANRIDMTGNYEDWQNIGFALALFGEDGRDLYQQVSQFHPEYDPVVTDKKFDSFLKHGGSRITKPAIFFRLAKDHGLDLSMPKTQTPAAPPITQAKYIVTERDAKQDELEDQLFPQVRKKFTDLEIETVLSAFTLKHLHWKTTNLKKEKEAKEAYSIIAGRFHDLHWFSLESFSVVKNRKYITYTATDEYPIFLIDEEKHKMVYQPLHPDKGSRFQQFGEQPKDFLHGLKKVEKKYNEEKERIETEEMERAEEEGDKKKKKKEDPRLPEVYFCRGCSDAINLRMLGYTVIWTDKPNGQPSQYQYDQQLSKWIQKLYQVTTLDRPGKRIAHDTAMRYLDMINIELPEDLLQHKDVHGQPCRDVRDYLNHYKEYDLKKLVENAVPYSFWDKKYSNAGVSFDVSNTKLYNFLQKNGFWRMRIGDKGADTIFVRIQGNTVTEVEGDDIRGFIKLFLRERMFDRLLRDAVFNTTKVNDTSLNNLDETDIDFTDFDKNSQYLFFNNGTVEVSKDNIKLFKPGEISRYVWQEELHNHRYQKLKEEPFSISINKFGNYDITINNKECLFLKYLVQTSRVHWRKELEGEKFNALSHEEREKYLKENHCNIAGPLLDQEETDEQKLHLVNKLFTIGYLFHRYKDRKKPWFIYAMDDKIPEDGRSHGGSGKSIMFDMAIRAGLTKNFYINGRNTKLNDDPHKYDGLTEHDRYILIDDAHQYLKLDLFFTDITGDIKVNPKGKKPYAIPFVKGGKFAFTSNYPPRNLDSSILRRILFVVFSDYYHTAGETNDYKETRDPGTDLGVTLFTEFTPEQWNHYYNLVAHCLKFYFNTTEKITPAMGNVTKKNLLATMGMDFYGWAQVYFSEESDRLDRFYHRQHAFQDYRRDINNKITPQGWMERLKAFCTLNSYICNPSSLLTGKGKNIIKKVLPTTYDPISKQWKEVDTAKKTAEEMIYIQTKDELTIIPEDDDMPF